MTLTYRAVFEKRNRTEHRNSTIEVFCINQFNRDKIYLGTLDSATQFGYEDEYVFNLDAEHIVEECGGAIHIPTNVLKQIAEFRGCTE
jgi:hypothetical protein